MTAVTFCRASRWYVSLRVGTHTSAPFEVPDDPPIPALVTVRGFLTLRGGSMPAMLVERGKFGSATIYELFTSTRSQVTPAPLIPAGMLL